MLLIRKARVLIGKFWRRVNILVNESGKIVKLLRSEKVNQYLLHKVDAIYNAKENFAFPGIIDMHVHFREPGYEYKEDFSSGSKAAIAGGVTIVADMPNNKPRIKSFDEFIAKLKRVKEKSYVDFLLYVEIPENLAELDRFADNDIFPAGVKVYFYLEDEANRFMSSDLPSRFLYVVHAEDNEFILDPKDCETYSAFEASRPREAEKSAVIKAIQVAKKGIRVHITHVSTLDALMEINKAKKMGLPVTADVTIHHLFFTKKDGERLKSIAKCLPPLRDELDRKSLLKGILQGIIDAIISDHAPHAPDEKKLDLCKAPPGIASIQYFLPLVFTLWKKLHITNFRQLIKVVSENPARILGLKNRGKIRVGYYGDIVVFDPKKRWKILGEDGFSKAKLTPWEGMRVTGWVKATFLRGRLVYEDGEFIEKIGKFISQKIEE